MLLKPSHVLFYMDYFLLGKYIFYWMIFGLSHTILAFEGVKDKFPLKGRGYRIFYNIVATLIFLFVIVNVPSLSPYLFSMSQIEFWRKILAVTLFAVSGIFGILGLMAWNLLGFVGLKEEDDPLRTDGIYKISRHPVYTSAILAFFAFIVIDPNETTISWLLGAGGYFVVGSYFEEKKLLKVFKEYSEYRNKVGRFFPWRGTHFKTIAS